MHPLNWLQYGILMCQEMITTVYKVITAHRGNIYSALDGLFAHRTGANYPMRERERQREREGWRGRFITQRRLQSGLGTLIGSERYPFEEC